LESDPQSDNLRDGLAVLKELAGGKPPDAASLETAASALAALVEQHGATGALDDKAETSALLAVALRIRAGLADEPNRRAALQRAHEYALKARDHAIKAAEKGGVNDVNLAAYVRATNEAAECALTLGEADSSDEGSKLLGEAADYFAEAATGYRRLRRENDAHLAGIKALEARSRRALRT
jgi:hypothetical protein